MTLSAELEARTAKSRANFDAERSAVYKKAAAAIAAIDILETALQAGEETPMFELPAVVS